MGLERLAATFLVVDDLGWLLRGSPYPSSAVDSLAANVALC